MNLVPVKSERGLSLSRALCLEDPLQGRGPSHPPRCSLDETPMLVSSTRSLGDLHAS